MYIYESIGCEFWHNSEMGEYLNTCIKIGNEVLSFLFFSTEMLIIVSWRSLVHFAIESWGMHTVFVPFRASNTSQYTHASCVSSQSGVLAGTAILDSGPPVCTNSYAGARFELFEKGVTPS